MKDLFVVALACSMFFCSNGENADSVSSEEDDLSSSSSVAETCFQSEIPYTGLPRIVIETENLKEVEDRDTEISATLQVWGECSPETEMMELTIKGRGNSTWGYPKKPYSIKFSQKQAFLGMPEAKRWVLLANYRDRTLIRNAVAFELAKRTSLEWTPSGKFADVYLNGAFIGNYYVCEKIESKKERFELGENGFLLELDTRPDEITFKTKYNGFNANVKYPKKADSAQVNSIKEYLDLVEYSLRYEPDNTYQSYIDQESYADYFMVYAVSTNTELYFPKSAYVHKKDGGKLNAGPVWDFDYLTFDIRQTGLLNSETNLYEDLFKKDSFKKVLYQRWLVDRKKFDAMDSFVDSLANYIKLSSEQNSNFWPVEIGVDFVGDEDKPFLEAVDMLKMALHAKVSEMDSLLKAL